MTYLQIINGLYDNVLFGTVWSQTVETLLQDRTVPVYDGVRYCATLKKTRTHKRSSPKPCKPRCEPDSQKHTKCIINSYGELVSAWKEMVLVSFGTQSRHWLPKTKEHQEHFQLGQSVSGIRT